jgi:hypothetical protein
MIRVRFMQVVVVVTKVSVVILVVLAIYYASNIQRMPTLELQFAVGGLALALAGAGLATLQSTLNERALNRIMTKLDAIETGLIANRQDSNREQVLSPFGEAVTGIVRLLDCIYNRPYK